jgi:hypothetical protein
MSFLISCNGAFTLFPLLDEPEEETGDIAES